MRRSGYLLVAVTGLLMVAPVQAWAAPPAALGALGSAAAHAGDLPQGRIATPEGLGETTGAAAVLTSSRLSFLDPGAVVGKIEDLGKCILNPITGLPDDPSNVVTGPAKAVGCAAGEVAGAAGEAATGVVAKAATGIADEWAKSVLEGTSWLLRKVAEAIDRSTTPNVDAAWFRGAYTTMGAVSLLLVTPLLFFSLGNALLRRDAGQAFRSACFNLPVAVVLSACALTLTQLGIAVTDWACTAITTSVDEPGGHFLASTSKAVGYDSLVAGGHGLPTFVALGAGLLAFVCSVVVWIEFVIRDAAVYLCSFFLPLAFAGSVWPRTARASRRVVALLAAVVFSKFVIVAVLSLAGRAAFAGVPEEGIEPLLAAIAMLLLAVAAPATLVALIPLLDEDGGHDGLRRGVSQAGMRLPVPGPREVMRNVAREHSAATSGSANPAAAAPTAMTGAPNGGPPPMTGNSGQGPASSTARPEQPQGAGARPPGVPAQQAVRRVVDIAEGQGATAAPLRSASRPSRPASGSGEIRNGPASNSTPPQPSPPDAPSAAQKPAAVADSWTPEPPA